MCGIFGVVGQKGNVVSRWLRFWDLAILNERRGSDSWGYGVKVGERKALVRRTLGPPSEFGVRRFMDGMVEGEWVLGHTRAATHGKVCVRNAHPFRVGGLLGAHNGVVPEALGVLGDPSIEVDSHALLALLEREGWEVLRRLRGCAALWVVRREEPRRVWLYRWGAPLSVGFDGLGNVWFSSEGYALTCLGLDDVRELPEGRVCWVEGGEVVVEGEEIKMKGGEASSLRGVASWKWWLPDLS